MPVICPAVLAASQKQYHDQMEKVAHFAHRLQIDLTDGVFAQSKTVKPEDAWWPVGIKADFHLMYKNPQPAVNTIMQHKPNLIIVHAEAEGNFTQLADFCLKHNVRAGVALLPETPPETIMPSLGHIDHVLIFGGSLGYQGGKADLRQLEKTRYLKSHKQSLEIGWDGGVTDQNVAQIVSAGVDVLNVGGYIQNSPDPARTFLALQRIADETGTT